MKQDVSTVVVQRIIEALEEGVAPWVRPWKAGFGAQTSLSTLKPYRGINTLILETTAMLRGYESHYWGTYKQLSERGGQVRKGEHGTPVVLWKPVRKTIEVDGEEQDDSYLLMRYFNVFNAEQADGVTLPVAEAPEVIFTPHEAAEKLINGMPQRPQVKHNGDRAFYSPTLDIVSMPVREAFSKADDYYAVLLHELAHSTGHESRLNRDTVTTCAPFGSEVYAKEELVAEIASAMLLAGTGLEPNIGRSASYAACWLQYVKDNARAVISAAGQAQKARDWIAGNGKEEK